MSDAQSEEHITQLFLSSATRVSGRDYYEASPATPELLLMSLSSQELDERAADNEAFFRRRFAMDLSHPARLKVLRLKKTHGFTDREIRLLRISGQLLVEGRGVRLSPCRQLTWCGGFYGVAMTLSIIPQVVAVQVSGAPTWQRALATSVLLGIWLLTIVGVLRYFVKPYTLAQHSQNLKKA